MPLRRALILAAVLAVAVPAPTDAGVELVTRSERIGESVARTGDRAAVVKARPAPLRFNMVGLHWRGAGTVWFRTAAETGQWSEWLPARPEAEDGPDSGSSEAAARAGWQLGNPWWTGPARYIQYRLVGDVARLRAHFLSSEVTAGTAGLARASAPTIIRRSQWGADESIVRAPAWYADRLRLAIVHHTAGTNAYSASESAAIVRGIQRYHVLANGWNDIGYNFLVDKYGQVFEGRAGGIDKPVGGAHAQGFNTGSTGIAVLGTYSARTISTAARSALVKLISWRLDVAHVDPLSRLTYVSHGSDRFPAGTAVRLRAVSGHRDTSSTSCPGNLLYDDLGQIAGAAAARGLPKLYDPSVSGGLGGSVRITARLSSALPWTVTIRDAAGGVVAGGSGTGTAVAWTWDASAVSSGTHTWSITAGPDVRPATGRVPGPPALALTDVAASPRVLSPNGDGFGEATTISFEVNLAATLTATVRNSSGAVVATLLADEPVGAGSVSVRWKGITDAGALVADGHYRVRVEASTGAQNATASRRLTVDRTLGFLAVEPVAFSPNGDGRQDLATIRFELARPADVDVFIRTGDRIVDELATGPFASGSAAVAWDGNGPTRPVRDGVYRAVVRATTSLGTRKLAHAITVDTTRPVVKILAARYRDGVTAVRFSLNEWASLRVYFENVLVLLEREAGTYSARWRGRADSVRISARDRAGNIRRTPRVDVESA